MSLTDHDIIDGLPEAFEAAAKYPDFTLVPGIEMSTDIQGGEVHILGHFIDWENRTLPRAPRSTPGVTPGPRPRDGREAGASSVSRWPWERVEAFADEGSVGRPHIAQAMVEAGHVIVASTRRSTSTSAAPAPPTSSATS